MPKEAFYLSGQIEGDGNPPDFVVSWGTDHDGGSSTLIAGPDEKPYIIAKPNDTAGLSRLIKALTRARTHMIQNRAAQPLVEVPDWLKADHTRPRPVEIIDNEPDKMPTHWGMETGEFPSWQVGDDVQAVRTGMVKGRKVQTGSTYVLVDLEAGSGTVRLQGMGDNWFPIEWFAKRVPAVELPEGVSIEEHVHKPRQHRDGKPPWCNACGLTVDGKVPESKFITRRRNDDPVEADQED